MTTRIPIKAIYSGSNVTSLGEFVAGDTIAVAYTDAKIVSVGNTAPILVTTTNNEVQVSFELSGVDANTYGSSELIPVFTVDSFGRITSASNVSLQSYLEQLAGNIIPSANDTFSLGTVENRFKDLYLSGNTLFLGNVILKENNGNLAVLSSDLNTLFTTESPAGVSSVAGAGGAVSNTQILDGIISTGHLTTANIIESGNLYYTDERVYSNVSLLNYATTSYVNQEVANLVASAPATLDTLNELALALGSDNNFSTTVVNLIGSSFNQANTAFTNAGSAFDKANAVLVVTGTAFDKANIATTNASNAFDEANTATTIASAGYDQANIATTNASNAFDKANLGILNADTVFDFVNAISTSNVTEGSNLYFTNAKVYANVIELGYATTSYVNQEVANLVASAPATLDTLNELAQALNNDNNFSATIVNLIGSSFNQANTAVTNASSAFDKANIAYSTADSAYDYANALTTAEVPESGNLYFTQVRARESISVTGAGSYDNATGIITITGGVTSVAGATGAVSNAQILSGLLETGHLTTANISEVTNLYFSNQRVYDNVISLDYATKSFAGQIYDQANVATTTGQNAFDKANIATTVATSSYDQANIATVNASEAFDNANTATTIATTAYDQANIATVNASASFDQANVATTNASNAFDKANAATTIATTAYDQANVATTNASNAYDEANSRVQTVGGVTNTVISNADLAAALTDANVTFFDVNIEGNLQVTGNITYLNVAELKIEDAMIYLNANSNTSNPDIGFSGNYNDGTYQHAGFFRDATDGVFKVYDQYLPEPDASPFINTADASFHLANLQATTFIGNLTGIVSSLANHTTDNLTEGSNLYYTVDRANTAIDNRVTKAFVDNLNVDADTLDSQNGTYYLDWTNTTNKPSPNITLAGDLSGSVVLSELGNGTLTATIVANSVELGTDTTGVYVANLVQGAGIVLTNLAGEGATPTVALSSSGVEANTYGGASKVPVLTVDQYGRITSAANVNVAGVTNFAASGNSFTISTADGNSFTATIQENSVRLGADTTGAFVANLVQGTGITLTNLAEEGATPTVALAASGVEANTYGGASKVPVLTVDTYGRITSAANVNVAGVTNFAASGNTFTISTADGNSFAASIQENSVRLGTDTTGAYVANLVQGAGIVLTNLADESATPTVALATSGVEANTYGGASFVPVVTVDTYGRVTSAANVSVAGVANFTNTGNSFTISTADGGSYTANLSNLEEVSGTAITLTGNIKAGAFVDNSNRQLLIKDSSGTVVWGQ